MSEEISKKLDLDRTGEIFDSLIERSKINNTKLPFGDDQIKQVKTVLSAGNLHERTARTKVTALRLTGYRDNLAQLKNAIVRKARKARRG